jgi:hypothetical protein
VNAISNHRKPAIGGRTKSLTLHKITYCNPRSKVYSFHRWTGSRSTDQGKRSQVSVCGGELVKEDKILCNCHSAHWAWTHSYKRKSMAEALKHQVLVEVGIENMDSRAGGVAWVSKHEALSSKRKKKRKYGLKLETKSFRDHTDGLVHEKEFFPYYVIAVLCLFQFSNCGTTIFITPKTNPLPT